MQNRYLYSLSVNQLRDAVEKKSDVTHVPLSMIYADKHAELRDGEWTGIKVFNDSVNRAAVTTINGVYKKIPKDEARSVIEKNLNIDSEKINTSFSQNLLYVAAQPLILNKEIGSPRISITPSLNGLKDDIYREGDDVYYKVKLEQYDFTYTEGPKEGTVIKVNGPVEVLFKLEDGPHGSIFALQQISTNSAFLRAAFLGEKGLEMQLGRVENSQNALNEIQDKLLPPLTALNEKLSLTDSEKLTQKAYFDALTAVGHYQKGTISANQLINELKDYESIIKKSQPMNAFFRRRSSTVNKSNPSYAIQIAIEIAKKLPYAEVKDVKINITSIHAENKAVEQKSTVSRRPSGMGS